MAQVQIAGALKELFVFRVGAGPATFNVIDAEQIELLGNGDLIVDGERNRFPLGAVAEGGIKYKDLIHRNILAIQRFPRPPGKAAAAWGRNAEARVMDLRAPIA